MRIPTGLPRNFLIFGGIAVWAVGLVSCVMTERTILMPPFIEGATIVGAESCAKCHSNITRGFHDATHAHLTMTGDDGKPTEQVVSVFKVTAGGTAVQETVFPGQPHEMVTVYHLDGGDLLLTHYCAAGNQPRMKLDAQSPQDQLVFKFAGGTNLDPQRDMHMHEGSIKFLDDDRIQWNWQGYAQGKANKDHTVSMTLVRKK